MSLNAKNEPVATVVPMTAEEFEKSSLYAPADQKPDPFSFSERERKGLGIGPEYATCWVRDPNRYKDGANRVTESNHAYGAEVVKQNGVPVALHDVVLMKYPQGAREYREKKFNEFRGGYESEFDPEDDNYTKDMGEKPEDYRPNQISRRTRQLEERLAAAPKFPPGMKLQEMINLVGKENYERTVLNARRGHSSYLDGTEALQAMYNDTSDRNAKAFSINAGLGERRIGGMTSEQRASKGKK